MQPGSGRQKLIAYLTQHLGQWMDNQTLRTESGIDDVTRTLRSLRQQGWDLEMRPDGYYRLNAAAPGPARGRRGSISQKTRYLVLQKFQGHCRACGRGAEDGVKLVVDHVIPVDWGGSSDIDNLQPLCTDCNQGKQAWVADTSREVMAEVFRQSTVERRIEALFDRMPNQDIPSLFIQLASGNAFDWQRALRRVRERSGKRILPTRDRRGYRYVP